MFVICQIKVAWCIAVKSVMEKKL